MGSTGRGGGRGGVWQREGGSGALWDSLGVGAL